MGNLPSSSRSLNSNARCYGRWENNQPCSCERRYWRCYHVHHQAVPTRYVLFYHHCVKLRTQCENCGLVFYITIENTSNGNVQFHHGLYQHEHSIVKHQDIDISYDEFYEIYESLRHRAYNLITYNCITFARECYGAIVAQNRAR